MKFSEVIGQEEAKQLLRQMVAEGRVPHALLFCGPKGCGKMALAMTFASYLLCRNHDGNDDSCDNCNQCAMLRKWEHPDLHFTYPVIRPSGETASHKMTSDDFSTEWHEMLRNGIYFDMEQWLDYQKAVNQQAQIGVGESTELLRKLSLKSSQGGYKISIIWLPENMNQECANALLKLLEEPPTQTVFIMVTEEPERLLDTIKSRAQRFDIKKIDNEAIEKALVERRGVDEVSAKRIARLSNGNWTRALQELDFGNENKAFLDLFIILMRMAYMRNVKELAKWSDTVANFGREKQKRFLVYFIKMIRENFIFNFHNPELNYMTQDEENFSKNFARFVNEANVIPISELLTKAQRDIIQNANGKIVFFDLALNMIVLLIQK